MQDTVEREKSLRHTEEQLAPFANSHIVRNPCPRVVIIGCNELERNSTSDNNSLSAKNNKNSQQPFLGIRVALHNSTHIQRDKALPFLVQE
jgi:hypothetical protein